MTGEDDHPASVVSDEYFQTVTYLRRGVAVVGQCEDRPGVLASDPYQVGDAMNKHPGFAGARTCQHQHIRLFRILRHYSALRRVPQVFDDGPPGLRRGLP